MNPYTIRVAPGTYNETVIVNKSVQLLGAQAGVDARARLTLAESIVTSIHGQGVIQVVADNVVVDGFTVQGNTAGFGIHTQELFTGFWIFDNIVWDNSYGIYINTSGRTISQVKRNLLFNNNILGNAVYSDQGAYNAVPPNRRLDATNNWWGSPTSPAPIGTGDAVIDPDGVAEITPFLTTELLLLPNRVVTTGPLQSQGSNAQTIIVDILVGDSIRLLGRLKRTGPNQVLIMVHQSALQQISSKNHTLEKIISFPRNSTCSRSNNPVY